MEGIRLTKVKPGSAGWTLTGGVVAVPTGPRYGGAEAPIDRRQKAIVCPTLSFGNVQTPDPTLTGGALLDGERLSPNVRAPRAG